MPRKYSNDMSYDEQLKTEDWKIKRDSIIERDMRVCQVCLTGKNLNVHHRYYIKDKFAWEYPDSALTTLCKTCHKTEHDSGLIEIKLKEDPYTAAWERIRQSVRALEKMGGIR